MPVLKMLQKHLGKYDEKQSCSKRIPTHSFSPVKKMVIPGFIEGLGVLIFSDKAVIFIPSRLLSGAAGAGGVIPPNANIVFEIYWKQCSPTTSI
jgi:peptidylprolyl isomerase